jgi:peroxiredoxin
MKWYLNTLWIKPLLACAGVCNFIFGLGILFYYSSPDNFSNLHTGHQSLLWEVLAVLVCAYGVGYLIAATNPFRHWVVVMLGLTFNLVTAFVLGYYILSGKISESVWLVILINNLIWVAPFVVILFGAFEQNRRLSEQLNYFYTSRADVNSLPVLTNKGASIVLLAESTPVMLVFLRQFGCTFCRETLNAIARDRKTIEALGTKIVLIHMATEARAKEVMEKYNLSDLHRISDTERFLYNYFALEQGNFEQLFGLKVIARSIIAGVFGKNSIGSPEGDYTQLPGVFLVHKGKVVKSYRHFTAADTPDYVYLANCETCM